MDADGFPDIPGEVAVRDCTIRGEHGKHVVFCCPKCGEIHECPITPLKNKKGFGWTWNGSESAPTLTPSIDVRVEDGGCGWHGFLTDGKLV